MSILGRIALIIASLLLILVFYFPLWEIGLRAPQYPEGLNLQIWINQITGDIRTINILNHYIGMGKVEPEKIPELAWFPKAFIAFVGSGLLVAALNRRKFMQMWCLALAIFAALSMYDFYRWEYDYGHNLSDDAPMKLEESYQPPLIGTKQILNIEARSWPAVGGYSFSAATVIAMLVLAGSLFRKSERSE